MGGGGHMAGAGPAHGPRPGFNPGHNPFNVEINAGLGGRFHNRFRYNGYPYDGYPYAGYSYGYPYDWSWYWSIPDAPYWAEEQPYSGPYLGPDSSAPGTRNSPVVVVQAPAGMSNATAAAVGPPRIIEAAQESSAPIVKGKKPAMAQAEPISTPSPVPATLFILRDGQRIEARRYLLTVSSLQFEQDGNKRKIPMSAVNVEATVAANRERGLHFVMPQNDAEITLGF
jgi:hypothetical protein